MRFTYKRIHIFAALADAGWQYPEFPPVIYKDQVLKSIPMLNPKEQKIFLVDDDSLCLHLHQQFLVKLGYTDISCFNGGKDCLANLHQRPAIIFLDYTMEEMNGIDVLQSIKTFDDNINVVFISGQERVNIAVDALKYGAFDYIVKSRITVDVLQRTIERIVAEKRVTVIPVKKGFFSRMKSNWGR